MKTVEVVIRISKEEYDYMIANPTRYNVCDDETLLYNYIKDGIPLPKGHGRLVDAAKIAREVNRAWTLWEKKGEDCYLFADVLTPLLVSQPTVIEADKAEGEG